MPVRSRSRVLHLRQILLRVAAQVAEFVEILVYAGGNHTAVA